VNNNELCDNGDHELRLGMDSIVYSNLGGLGPHTQLPEGIRYTNVFPKSGHVIDLIVTTVEPYFADDVQRNDMLGRFAVIAANPGSSTMLRFSFVDKATEQPITVPGFLFTLANFNMQQDGGGAMVLTAFGIHGYHLAATSSVKVEEDSRSNATTFSPTVHHSEMRAGLHPYALAEEASTHAVTVQYGSVSEFEVRVDVDEGASSRYLAFAGQSSMACNPRALCYTFQCPQYHRNKHFERVANGINGSGADVLEMDMCKGSLCNELDDRYRCCVAEVPLECLAKRSISLGKDKVGFSNLGSSGPHINREEGILYKDVFPGNLPKVDMLVSAENFYVPGDPKRNGAAGENGVINVAGGESVDLKFSFRRHGTTKGMTVHTPFWITFWDFDSGLIPDNSAHSAVVGNSVSSRQHKKYVVSNLTMVRNATSVTGRLVAVFGNREGHKMEPMPVHTLAPQEEVMDRMISFYYQYTRDFRITLAAAPGEESHDFFFGGPTALTCPTSGRCTSYTCPIGFRSIENAEEVLCNGPECEESDVDTCCHADLRSECTAERFIRFRSSALMNNNLGGLAQGDRAPRSIVVGNILPSRTTTVDLDVRVSSGGYDADFAQNGITDGFLNIHVKTHVTLSFQFVNRETRQPIVIDQFFFSFADLKNQEGHGDQVTAYEVDSYVVSPSSHIEVSHKGNSKKFLEAMAAPVPMRSNIDPLLMSNDEQDGAVHILYHNRSEFSIRLDTKKTGGSLFRFFGRSTLPCPRETPGMCSSFSCPAPSWKPKPRSEYITCSSSPCEKQDLQTCCIPVYDECNAHKLLSLDGSKIEHSNLGGLGPDLGKPPSIVFRDVFPKRTGGRVNLEISNTSTYLSEKTSHNTANVSIASINLAGNTSVQLKFRLLDAETGKLIKKPWKYFFTVLDIDGTKEVTFQNRNVSHLITTDDTFITRAPVTLWAQRLQSATSGMSAETAHSVQTLDMFKHSSALTLDQVAKAATFLMHPVPEFTLNLSTPSGSQGDDFFFTGASNVACEEQATCNSYTCPVGFSPMSDAGWQPCQGPVCGEDDIPTCCMSEFCEDTNIMTLAHADRNNLGGMGPNKGQPKVVRFVNVFPAYSKVIDLEVSTTSKYYPHNTSANGRIGAMGRLNLKTGSYADITFHFRDHHTNEPTDAPRFLFSIMDMDVKGQRTVDLAGVSVQMSGHEFHRVSEDTMIDMDSNGTLFTSMGMGDYQGDFVFNPLSMGAEQKNQAVTFGMPSLSTFKMSLTVGSGLDGRNVYFGGASNLFCKSRAPCSSMQCAKMAGQRNIEGLVCADSTCSKDDTQTCCLSLPSASLKAKKKSTKKQF